MCVKTTGLTTAQAIGISVIIATLGLATPITLHAEMIAADLDYDIATTTRSFGGGQTGWLFHVNQDISVTMLGWFDLFGDGLGVSHDLGIWDRQTEALIVSATVPAGTAATLGPDNIRYVSVPASLLQAGTDYVIAGVIGSDGYITPGDPNQGPSTATFAPEITKLGAVTSNSTTLQFPEFIFDNGSNARFGPNFQFVTGTVPEPSSLALLGMGGLAMLGYGRQRRRKRQSSA